MEAKRIAKMSCNLEKLKFYQLVRSRSPTALISLYKGLRSFFPHLSYF